MLNGEKDVSTAEPETQAQVKTIQTYQAAADPFADMALWSGANNFYVGVAGLAKNPVQQTPPALSVRRI